MTAIRHIFTSPGHNYFGHHGKNPDEFVAEEHESIELIAGKGIVGDRFFDWKEDYKGQITFIDAAVVDEVKQKIGQPDLSPAVFRRNVVIEGVNLNSLIGKNFSLGDAQFAGVEECSPCYWMDRATGREGVEELLQGRGGLRCRILTDAPLGQGPCELAIQD